MPDRELHTRVEPHGDGSELIIRYFLDDLDGGQVGPTRIVSREDLRGLGLADALRADGPALRERFGDPQQALPLGERLCLWLFGDTNEQRALFRSLFGVDAVCTTQAARLVLHTDDADVAAQPWCLLAWKGTPLVRARWSMQLSRPGSRSVTIPEATRLLIVCPRAVPGPDIGADTHVQRLRVGLEAAEPAMHVHIVRSTAELWTALTEAGAPVQWDFVYFYGHGSDNQAQPGLVFPEGVVTAQQLAERLAPCHVKLLLLNCCLAGAGGWLSAVSQLRHAASVVAGHAVRIPADEARAAAVTVFDRIVRGREHPAVALCTLPPPSETSYTWMSPVVVSSVPPGGWRVEGRRRQAGTVASAGWPFLVNRLAQRDRVLSEVRVHLVAAESGARALACVVTGGPDSGVAQLGRVVEEHLARAAVPTKLVSLQAPADASRPEQWEHSLREALQAQHGAQLRDAALAFVARHQLHSEPAPVLLLDFGGHPSPPGPPMGVKAWVRMLRQWSGLFEPTDRPRFVALYGLEIDDEAHRVFRRAWDDALAADFAPGRARPLLLDRLALVRRADLVAFLVDDGPAIRVLQSDAQRVADAVLEALGDGSDEPALPFPAVVAWLERARTSTWWAALGLTTEPGQAVSTISDLM